MGEVAILKRGGNHSFTKNNPFLHEIDVVFSWDVLHGKSPITTKVIPVVIPTGSDGMAHHEQAIIFSNQLSLNSDASVTYSVDSENQEGLHVKLSDIPQEVSKLFCVLLVNPDIRVNDTFDVVRKVKVDVLNRDNSAIVHYAVDDSMLAQKKALEICEIYRYNDEWKFRANGFAFDNLEDVETKFGVVF